MDIMEANTEAQQYTTHACVDACGSFTAGVTECKGTGSPSSVCDQSGCGLNPFRYGPGTTYNTETNNIDWYGPGSANTLDSMQPFTVVTQFHESGSGGNGGELTNITRFYLQKGKRIDLPTLYVKTPTDGQHMGAFAEPAITSEFCGDIYDRWSGGERGADTTDSVEVGASRAGHARHASHARHARHAGLAGLAPLAQMGKNMENGMVLAMSAWYAQETYTNGKPQGSQTGMSWLDGVNQWGKFIKAGPCDTSTSESAGPYHATFSDIRFGDIGTTVPNAPPAPVRLHQGRRLGRRLGRRQGRRLGRRRALRRRRARRVNVVMVAVAAAATVRPPVSAHKARPTAKATATEAGARSERRVHTV